MRAQGSPGLAAAAVPGFAARVAAARDVREADHSQGDDGDREGTQIDEEDAGDGEGGDHEAAEQGRGELADALAELEQAVGARELLHRDELRDGGGVRWPLA